MLPKVSVMLVTYNHKNFIRESIESVLSQDYPNLEIVVGDDASTDGTQEIIQEYVAKYPELFKVILAKNNEGVTANCNRTFFACTGQYIAFFSGDDVMLPGKIKKQVAVLEKDKTLALCATSLEVFRSKTQKIMGILRSTSNGFDEGESYSIEKILEVGEFQFSSLMARRSMCPETGYNSQLPIASDFLFFLETLTKGNIQVLDEVLYRYRVHDKNVTKSIGVAGELLKSLEIFEEKHPSFKNKTQKYKILLNYSRGVELFMQGYKYQSRVLFLQSVSQGNKNYYKSLVWIFILFCPNFIQILFRNLIFYWKTQKWN